MSLAWGSLVLLVVLLPGVLFFIGLHLPEKFTRDLTERSALGQLAGVLLISVGLHGVLYAASPLFCGQATLRIPCTSFNVFVTALMLDTTDTPALTRVTTNVSTNRQWILLYLLSSAAMGVGLGYLVGKLVVRGWFPFLIQHRWAYKLSLDGLTTAWVLTHIRAEDRILMYRGFPRAFHLKRDGTFSYIVLQHVRRGYLVLEDKSPSASDRGDWPSMGRPIRQDDEVEPEPGRRRYLESLFAIEGEDIANIVFDRYSVGFKFSLTDKELIKAMQKVMNAVPAQSDHRTGASSPY